MVDFPNRQMKWDERPMRRVLARREWGLEKIKSLGMDDGMMWWMV